MSQSMLTYLTHNLIHKIRITQEKVNRNKL
jgi:hypothetical protein